MKLQKVYIYPNMKASEVETTINEKIEEYSRYDDVELDYELLIENSVRIGEYADTVYTLLINIEEKEQT